ncbi:MAG TPA: bacteriohemerythrin [Methanocella sp.]|nr:bacteriohemerythrin [Methanocella sp.]
MTMLTWSDKYSVNVKEIDGQHMKLIGLLNELHTAMSAGKGKVVVSGVLKNLIEYTAYHFSAEENYMVQLGYPGYSEHRNEHVEFVKKVKEFNQKFEAGESIVTIDMIKFLNGWVSGHIIGIDKQYSQFFNQKGLK